MARRDDMGPPHDPDTMRAVAALERCLDAACGLLIVGLMLPAMLLYAGRPVTAVVVAAGGIVWFLVNMAIVWWRWRRDL